jgi:uncharacterized protein YraI
VTKSCPGTAFFGGNKVVHAQRSFFPLVRAAMGPAVVAVSAPIGIRYACVNVSRLNVRAGPGANFAKVNTVELGSVLRIHDEKSGWLRISSSRKEWVAARMMLFVDRATVKAPILNVRSGPAAAFDKLAALARGQEIFVHERRDGWCRIGMDTRWVSATFLEFA